MLDCTPDELKDLAERGYELYSPTCELFVFKVDVGWIGDDSVNVKFVEVDEAYDIACDISRNPYHEWTSLLEHGTGCLRSNVHRGSDWENWCNTHFNEENDWYMADEVDELVDVLPEYM